MKYDYQKNHERKAKFNLEKARLKNFIENRYTERISKISEK